MTQLPLMQSEHTAAFKIFNYNYRAFIPQFATYTEEYLKLFGIATSGDREIDRALAEAPMLCQMTIADMAEHLDNGVEPKLEDPKKSTEIYLIIREHLVAWKTLIDQAIHDIKPPIRDLNKLDALAQHFFPMARTYAKHTTSANAFQNRLTGTRAAPVKRPTKNASPQTTPEYKPMTPEMVKTMFSKPRVTRPR